MAGNYRSGHGIKRPDHSVNSGPSEGFWRAIESQKKHRKSVFSDLPDPSCHAHKKERDKMSGIFDDEKKIIQRKIVSMEYKDMQNAARQRVEKAFKMLDDILENPDASDSAKLGAFNAILDRAYGKSASTNFNVNATMDTKPSELDDATLTRQIAETLKVVEPQRREAETSESQERPANIRKYN